MLIDEDLYVYIASEYMSACMQPGPACMNTHVQKLTLSKHLITVFSTWVLMPTACSALTPFWPLPMRTRW